MSTLTLISTWNHDNAPNSSSGRLQKQLVGTAWPMKQKDATSISIYIYIQGESPVSRCFQLVAEQEGGTTPQAPAPLTVRVALERVVLRAPVWEPGRKTLFEGSILKWLGHLRGFLIGNPTFTHFVAQTQFGQ